MAHESDLLALAAAWRGAGRRTALATVVATWGSSPRPLGSQLLIDESGRFLGSVSGGCIEAEVVRRALEVIESNEPLLLDFGVVEDKAWAVGLSCGGHIQVYIEPVNRLNPEIICAILAAKQGKLPIALLTELHSGARTLVGPTLEPSNSEFGQDAIDRSRQLLIEDRNERYESATGPVFIQVFNPPYRLILVGAVHIAQPLAALGELAGYEILIIDPRRAFADGEAFAGFQLDTRWPDAALAELKPDYRTALVTLTHDPKLDEPALACALRTPVFYIGALGSRRTHESRINHLLQGGFSAAECARIQGPVGLSIGALTPAEIAISIMAQITQTRRRVA